MTHWISRLAQRLANLDYLSALDTAGGERDADLCRARRDLDAIRMHFPDHA